ncbi:MAG: Ig-like domain-containing protein [Mesorhizobium sp.]
MVAASILDGHVSVQVNGNVVAPNGPANFVVPGSPADVANYIREGNNLVIEMKSGQTFTIQGFAQQGLVNNIVLSAGGANTLVDISAAFTAAAVSNGILAPALITIEAIGASTSVMSLLGILGAAGAAGGVGLVALSASEEEAADVTAPGAPALDLVSDDVGTKRGAISSGGITDDTRPTFSGRGGEAGSTIELWEGSTLLGSSTVGSGGNWSVSPVADLLDGRHSLSLVQRNASGDKSDGTGFVVTVDTVAPEAPVIVRVIDAVDFVTGVIQSGGVTNDTRPVLSGTGEPGATVELRDGVTLVGTATVANDGTWSIRPASGLSEGVHTLLVVQIDAAGNQSVDTSFAIVVDSTAAAQLVIASVVDDVDLVSGALSSGDTSNDAQPLVSGSGAEAGAVIELMDGATLVGTAIAANDGTWSVSPTAALADGAHSLSVVQVDQAGNRSVASAAFNVTIDTDYSGSDPVTAPTTPDQADNRMPAIVVGSNLDPAPSLYVDGVRVDAVYDPVAGTLTPVAPIGDGSHSLTYTLSDAAGNESAPSDPLVISVDGAPDAPVIGAVVDHVGSVSGALASGGSTDDTRPQFSGSGGEAGATIELRDGNSVVGTATVANDGTWSVSPTVALANGMHSFTLAQTDVAGNRSPASAAFVLRVDNHRGHHLIDAFKEAMCSTRALSRVFLFCLIATLGITRLSSRDLPSKSIIIVLLI